MDKASSSLHIFSFGLFLLLHNRRGIIFATALWPCAVSWTYFTARHPHHCPFQQTLWMALALSRRSGRSCHRISSTILTLHDHSTFVTRHAFRRLSKEAGLTEQGGKTLVLHKEKGWFSYFQLPPYWLYHGLFTYWVSENVFCTVRKCIAEHQVMLKLGFDV